MAKMTNNIYCTNCGKANPINHKKCIACHHDLDEEEHPLFELVFGFSKDKLKGTFIDKAFLIAKTLIYKYTYGVLLTLAIAVSAVSVIVNNNVTKDSSEMVTERYDFRAFTEVEKLVGCWRVNLDDQTVYQRVDKDLYVVSGEIPGLSPSLWKNGQFTTNNMELGRKNIGSITKMSPDIIGDYSITKYHLEDSSKYYGTVPEEFKDNSLLSITIAHYYDNGQPTGSGVFEYIGFIVWADDNNFEVINKDDATNENVIKRSFSRVSCNGFSKI